MKIEKNFIDNSEFLNPNDKSKDHSKQKKHFKNLSSKTDNIENNSNRSLGSFSVTLKEKENDQIKTKTNMKTKINNVLKNTSEVLLGKYKHGIDLSISMEGESDGLVLKLGGHMKEGALQQCFSGIYSSIFQEKPTSEEEKAIKDTSKYIIKIMNKKITESSRKKPSNDYTENIELSEEQKALVREKTKIAIKEDRNIDIKLNK